MKKLNRLIGLAGLACFLALGSANLKAQGQGGRGNFDPEQMRQRMMDNYRERLEVKGDDEWKLISERIEKVVAAQRDVRGYSGRGGFGRGGRRGNQDGGGNADTNGNANRARNAFMGETPAEVTALEKALEAKAPAEELKAKMAKVRDGLKDKEAKLATAQDDLRKVLSVRQEAEALMAGLLK